MPDAPPTSLEGLRFLVVDDTAELREIITFVLEREGAVVDVAADGATAVARAAGSAFDVVLMDVGLPGVDGLEACRQITAARPTTVFMLSARDAPEDRAAGEAAGAAGYLSKPFTPRALVAELRELLSGGDAPG